MGVVVGVSIQSGLRGREITHLFQCGTSLSTVRGWYCSVGHIQSGSRGRETPPCRVANPYKQYEVSDIWIVLHSVHVS